jgi:hypothetical protein
MLITRHEGPGENARGIRPFPPDNAKETIARYFVGIANTFKKSFDFRERGEWK